jgi:hypothetical protein
MAFGRGQGHERGGMGLLEYQAMPSLRDVVHDELLCTFTIYRGVYRWMNDVVILTSGIDVMCLSF